jgi:hypothetical protein
MQWLERGFAGSPVHCMPLAAPLALLSFLPPPNPEGQHTKAWGKNQNQKATNGTRLSSESEKQKALPLRHPPATPNRRGNKTASQGAFNARSRAARQLRTLNTTAAPLAQMRVAPPTDRRTSTTSMRALRWRNSQEETNTRAPLERKGRLNPRGCCGSWRRC